MRIYIKAEALPGTEIIEAICQAIDVANRLDIMVRLNFNNKLVYVSPGDLPSKVQERWTKVK